MRWRHIRPGSAPQAPGVYAIKQGCRWLYIGQSQNIALRIAGRHHPLQIAEGRPGLSLWWMPAGRDRLSLERQLISQHNPEWNGSWQWHTPWPSCFFSTGASAADVAAAIEGA